MPPAVVARTVLLVLSVGLIRLPSYSAGGI
jgi:hypothetical protein